MPPTLRPALPSDRDALSAFIKSPNHIYRHLDWRDVLDWLGRQPYWLLEEDGAIAAALACVPEPEEVAWVRLFACNLRSSPDRAWSKLFEPALEQLRNIQQQATSTTAQNESASPQRAACSPPACAIASLALREWYEDMLKRKGFIHHQDIVVFVFDQVPPRPPKLDSSIRLREMLPAELAAIVEIDHLAFEPIWRLSPDDLRYALKKSSYCTVAEQNGQIIGYTMSSSTGVHAHLARLAVHPALQGQRIGFALLQDLLDHFINKLGFWGVTLNTQHDNHSSLALYHKTGFRETGERFPLYIYP